MSFNLGNNDRNPAFGTNIPSAKNRDPLRQAVNPSNNRGADMVLTPDHPSWHDPNSQAQQTHSYSQTSTEGHPPSFVGDRAGNTSTNRGPIKAGPDHESYLPPDAVPQGSRFDPIMPDNVHQSLPNRGGPGQGQVGQSPRGPASGEPDFDELLPPH
ncbi:hypothetical protein BGZ51_009350 [Haplosporangium sp. Z 767]|nr:hypothetical protein BGZ50_006894 [Haplosporangium sp. Z 11]KAF9189709.1 hypothetical protein BGZ51_009350 [Haplosporangium sp. Z 767]